MKLAKLGYYGSDPKKVLRAPADMVLDILRYEVFEVNLNDAYKQMQEREGE